MTDSNSTIPDLAAGVRPGARCGRGAFDAVLWDYDGTLVDSRRTDEEAVDRLLEDDPGAAPGAAVFWATEGLPIVERLERAWPGRSSALLPLFDAPSRPRLFPGVRRALAGLADRDLAMGVVSSRRTEPLLRGLAAAGLAGHFATVVGLESVRISKPDPEGLRMALRALRVEPGRAVYVGDRGVDVEAGRRAGMTVWQAVWSLACAAPHQPRPLLVAHPWEVVERVDGLSAAAG